MQIEKIIEIINAELNQHADQEYRELIRTRYNMNVDNFLGVRTPTIHKIADKQFKELKSHYMDERLAYCGDLLSTNIYEHKIIAFRWAYLSRKEFTISHLDLFNSWLEKFVDDWIDCDDLCVHVIGEFFLIYPQRANEVIQWTSSENLWCRRGAAVSLVLPTRKGEQIELALRVADLLLNDEEDLVLKGYGWLLKVASKNFPDEIFHFVMERLDIMPRVAFRYAIEKLPEQLKRQAMNK